MDKEGLANQDFDNTQPFTLAGKKGWARVVDVYDGDTVTLVFYVFDGYYRFSARMYGIDTAEMRGGTAGSKELAAAARARLVDMVTGGSLSKDKVATMNRSELRRALCKDACIVYVECLDFDKYGRLLVKIRVNPEACDTCTDVLIREGLGYAYYGATKESF